MLLDLASEMSCSGFVKVKVSWNLCPGLGKLLSTASVTEPLVTNTQAQPSLQHYGAQGHTVGRPYKSHRLRVRQGGPQFRENKKEGANGENVTKKDKKKNTVHFQSGREEKENQKLFSLGHLRNSKYSSAITNTEN